MPLYATDTMDWLRSWPRPGTADDEQSDEEGETEVRVETEVASTLVEKEDTVHFMDGDEKTITWHTPGDGFARPDNRLRAGGAGVHEDNGIRHYYRHRDDGDTRLGLGTASGPSVAIIYETEQVAQIPLTNVKWIESETVGTVDLTHTTRKTIPESEVEDHHTIIEGDDE